MVKVSLKGETDVNQRDKTRLCDWALDLISEDRPGFDPLADWVRGSFSVPRISSCEGMFMCDPPPPPLPFQIYDKDPMMIHLS